MLSDTLRRVDYANGVSIYVNYGAEAVQVDDCTVEAMSYYVKGGEN